MKKLILTTSALTLMGVASSASASDFDVSAEASVSYGNWGTAAGAAAFSFNTGVTIGLEASSGDLTWGAEVGIDADAGTVSDGVVWVSGGFGKVSFGIDEFDELSATSGGTTSNGGASSSAYGDVKYEGTFGAVTATLVADAGLGLVPTSTAVASWDLGVAYAGNGFNASVGTDSTGAWDLDADVEVGNFTIGAGTDSGGAWDVWASTTFGAVNAKATYDSGGTTGLELDGTAGQVSWAVSGDTAGGAAASIGYDADPWSVELAYDNDDAGTAGVADFGDEADLILTVGYAANDAVSFEILLNGQNEYEVSMTAGFTF